MRITNDIRYIGVNDNEVDLFEGQYRVPNGISYNSYVIRDEKTAVLDTVDAAFTHEWLENLKREIGEKSPDYLIVHHMEPDHAANIAQFMNAYPKAVVVASKKAFEMMNGFFGTDFPERRMIVGENDVLKLGRHTLAFLTAPMVHWPEVLVSYDSCDKALFSADGFGKFGIPDSSDDWADEARRYYIGIVGKYGAQVKLLLKKAAALDIQLICPLHGPVLTENLGEYLRLYDIWASYSAESEGIVIAYNSVYGNTKRAVELMEEKLDSKGCPNIAVFDLARCDMSEAVSAAFKYGKLLLAATTYNAGLFPCMRDYLDHLAERNFQNRTIGIIENGSWAPMAEKSIKKALEGCKNLTFAENTVHMKSALNSESTAQAEALAEELCREYAERNNETAHKNNMDALFNIGYGLYVVTSKSGEKDNGLIVNTVTQVTNSPNRIAVTISKENYSHDIIKQTGIMNVNCLSAEAPFSVFEQFGFKSGRDTRKFSDNNQLRSDNGLIFLSRYINSFMSLKVERYIDMGTHGMFICSVTEARVISDAETMTYTYYFDNVKPKPEAKGKKGFVCKICGYVHEGDELPDDFICPLCKHGAADFEPIE